VTLCNIL
jgi:fructose-1,6-bisphosphatase/sedoheptulose 1,7-bisphosphatase-like protein